MHIDQISQIKRFNSGVNLNIFFGYGPIPAVENSSYRVLTDKEVAELSSLGVKSVRIPIRWEQLQPTRGAALDTNVIGVLEKALAKLFSADIRATIDIHNSFKYNTDKSNIANEKSYLTLGSGDLTEDDFVDLWVRLSSKLKDNPAVENYDLMNEPQVSAQLTASAYQAAINAIRANGDKKEILIETVLLDSATTDWAATNPAYPLADSANRLRYSMHIYPMGEGRGHEFAAADAIALGLTPLTLVTKLLSFATFLQTTNSRGHLGEYAVGRDGPLWSAMNRVLHEFCRALDMPMAAWTYDVAGPNDPNNLKTTDGRLAAQWAVMGFFNGVTVPSSVSLLGPPTSYRLAPITINLDFRGLVPFNILWNFSDEGAGGSFSPSTLKLVAGDFNGYFNVTYTAPAADKLVNIVATNDVLQPKSISLHVVVAESQPTTGYFPPTLDGLQPLVAAKWVKTSAFHGVSGTKDIVSGEPTSNINGLVISGKASAFTSLLRGIMATEGPATLMVEVASFSGVAKGCRIVGSGTSGPGALIYAGNNSVIAYASDGTGGPQASSGGGAANPTRAVLAWDKTSIKLSVGGSNPVTLVNRAGIRPEYLGSANGIDDPFPNEIRALAVYGFKASDKGMAILSGDLSI